MSIQVFKKRIVIFFALTLSPFYPAGANDCNQADANFVIRKTVGYYDVLYKNIQIHRVDSAQLKDLFGHAEPSTDCDSNLSSREVMGIVVGWKKDLLIALGVVRDIEDGRPIRLSMLSWSPHWGEFAPILLVKDNELVVRYGDRVIRICWNRGGRQIWEFSDNHHEAQPGPCVVPQPPGGADQLLIPMR